ncbi:HD domain-containing protein [Brevibacillus sp. SYP-B805]|uniref:HD domain-containing protein n=1 Tax=Brevibacillus sp. SYP-B805 TaxID=1578199 RepID=UPI001F49F0B8|nr:HD domain-containing protein [Brevibacillus sp. SYP-B805]
MHDVFRPFVDGFVRTGNLEEDMRRFLERHGRSETAEHCRRVALEAEALALRWGHDPVLAKAAGYLHDISDVIPNHGRIEAARRLGLEVLPEEEAFPMIVHQKLSKVMAREIFGVEEEAVLSAIECHTTLKANAAPLDLMLFVADKVSWDQPGTPPYLNEVKKGLDISLRHAAFAYLHYLWERRDTLKVVHPWLIEAYHDLVKGGAAHDLA